MARCFLTVFFLIILHTISWSQQTSPQTTPPPANAASTDSVIQHRGRKKPAAVDHPYAVDSATRKKHDPRKATLYSTFFPGLGQIYNHKYWKLPIVYAAVGIPAYTFFYNKSWYNKCQYALLVVLSPNPSQDSINKVDPKLIGFVQSKDDNSLRTYRNSFRQDQDYSILFFLLFWGLNIVDATVDAHLMEFDVSKNLSLHMQPGPANTSGTTAMSGYSGNMTSFSFVFDIHKTKYKPIPLP